MDASRLTFEGFSLDLANEQLVCDGEVVALTPKAFAVLRRLLEDGGQLVSKEELLRAGWAKTHVSDGVLKVVILEIRLALDDDPAAPSFIETVPRRGVTVPLGLSAAGLGTRGSVSAGVPRSRPAIAP